MTKRDEGNQAMLGRKEEKKNGMKRRVEKKVTFGENPIKLFFCTYRFYYRFEGNDG